MTPSVSVSSFYTSVRNLKCSPNLQSIGFKRYRERFSAHNRELGISCKNAAHHLYMAELERVKRDQLTYKAYASLEESTKKTLQFTYRSIYVMEGDERVEK